MKSKKLFSLLCLVGSLSLTGLTSCNNEKPSTSQTSSTVDEKPTPEPVATTGSVSEKDGVVTAVGTYTYSSVYGSNPSYYGAQVTATIDAEGKITSVAVGNVEKDGKTYNNVTPSWSGTGKDEYLALEGKVATYDGQLATAVYKKIKSITHETAADDFPEGSFLINGATQTSGRTNAALAAALSAYCSTEGAYTTTTEYAKEEVYLGTVSYTSHNTNYGTKVGLSFVDSKLATVNVYPLAGNTYITSSWGTMSGVNGYQIKKEYALASSALTTNLKGKTKEEIQALVADFDVSNLDGTASSADYSVKQPELQVVSGATQTEYRIGLAIKNALASTAYTTTNFSSGEASAKVKDGMTLVTKVSIVVKENKVVDYTIDNHGTTGNGGIVSRTSHELELISVLPDLEALFLNKTVDEVKALTAPGQIVAGSTVSTDMFINAIKDAATKFSA